MIPVGMFLGVAVGAAATYVYKDDSAREWLANTSDSLKAKMASLTNSLKTKPEEVSAEEAHAEVVTVDDIEATETVAPSEEPATEVIAEKVETAVEEKKPRGRPKSKA